MELKNSVSRSCHKMYLLLHSVKGRETDADDSHGRRSASFRGLSSNSKCNTTGPDGLRCCHANELLHTLEC